MPAAKPDDGGQCFELHSVHGVLDCDFPHLGGKALEKAPPDDPKELCFLVYGTFAATEDDFENDRGCKDMLKVVKYKELYRLVARLGEYESKDCSVHGPASGRSLPRHPGGLPLRAQHEHDGSRLPGAKDRPAPRPPPPPP